MVYKYTSRDLIKKLATLLYEHKYHIILAAFLMIISSLTLIYAPKVLSSVMGLIEDSVYDHKPFTMLECLDKLTYMALLYIISNVSKYFMKKESFLVSENVCLKLRNMAFEKINSIPLDFFNHTYSGSILSRLSSDIGNIDSMIKTSILSFLTNIIMIFSIIIITMTVNTDLTLIFIVITMIYMVILFISYRKTRDYFLINQGNFEEMMGFIGDFLPNKITIQSMNATEYFKKRFKQFNDKQKESFHKTTVYSELFGPLNSLLINITQIGLYLYAGYLLYQGRIDVEVLATFMIYIQIFKKSMFSLAPLLGSIERGFASLNNVFEIIELPVSENSENLLKPDVIKGEIEFKHLHCDGVDDFNLKINEKEIVNLMGKPTPNIVNSLLSFNDDYEGEILLDGVNIKEYDPSTTRRLLGISLEENYLFQTSIYDNITYGKENISREEVIETCKMIGLDKLVQRFPDKYDTVVVEDFHNMSSGEKKLIFVARALIGNPKIIILDYPNYIPLNTLKNIIKDKTVLLLTPEGYEIEFADKIISLT